MWQILVYTSCISYCVRKNKKFYEALLVYSNTDVLIRLPLASFKYLKISLPNQSQILVPVLNPYTPLVKILNKKHLNFLTIDSDVANIIWLIPGKLLISLPNCRYDIKCIMLLCLYYSYAFKESVCFSRCLT